MITITSKQEGFRRAGIAHSTAPKNYPDNKFTAAELAALKAEPMLKVEISEAEDLTQMTIAQLLDEISRYQPTAPLKGVKKAELIEILTACQKSR